MELGYLGYFSKPHGIKGQLVLRPEHDFDADETQVLFVEMSSGKAPYFITELKNNKGGLIVSLEDLDGVEKARLLVGKKVFVEARLLISDDDEFSWLGFELIDKNHGSLGIISEVADNGQQLLVTINYKGKEVLLPLVEDFIERIDEAERKLFFKSPEGLIDMYLENKGL